MRSLKLGLMALLLATMAGCAALFGGPEQLRDDKGNRVVDEQGQPVMVYKPGAIQKMVKAIAPIAGVVPFGEAGLALLTLIGGIGAGVQTVRHKKRVDPDDVRKMIDDLGPEVKALLGDKDLGDLVKKWDTDSDLAKKLKAAFTKHRNGGLKPPA